MARLTSALLLALLASTALAAPKNRRYATGSGGTKKPCSTAGPYGYDNSTAMAGPTGTGAGSGPVMLSTVTVVPLPASTPEDSGSAAPLPASSTAAAGTQCGSGTTTVTYTPTVTVTASSNNAAGAASSTSADITAPYGNGTSSGFAGPTGSDGPTALPSLTDAPSSTFGTAAPLPHSSKKHGHKHESHHHSKKPYQWTSPMVSPPSSSSSTAAAAPAQSTTSSAMAASTSAGSSTAAPAVNSPSAEASTAAPAANSPPAYNSPAAISSTAAPVAHHQPVYTPPVNSPIASSTPAPSSSAAPAPAQPSTSSTSGTSSGGNGKRGLVYNTASLTSPFAKSTNINWAYNWDSQSSGLSPSYEFVPMLWGLDADHLNNFDANVAKCKAAGSSHLLAFNEPDMRREWGGSALDPGTGASGYKQHIAPYSGQMKLGSPGVSNANSSYPAMGMPWLAQFMKSCNGGCPVDFVVVHWYGDGSKSGGDQAKDLKWYIDHVKADSVNIFGKVMPIWLTEFSATPMANAAVNAEFLKTALPYLDNEPAVERYSFFMVTEGNLVSGGSLTSIGQAYVNN